MPAPIAFNNNHVDGRSLCVCIGRVRVRARCKGSFVLKNQNRKAHQLCRQVQRALNLALADRRADDGLHDLFVEDVTPAPHCGHLLVHVAIPRERAVADVLAALRQDAPRLRSEVATAITRKRAPELSFVPAFPEVGDDE